MPDKRNQKTLENIKESFFQLAGTKNINKISVKEICETANISRSTFYDYFEDYPSFLDALENQLVDEYLQISYKYNYDKNTGPMMQDLLNYICENNYKLFLFYREDSNHKALDRLYSIIKEKTLPIWLENSRLSLEQIDIIFTYFSKGMDAVLYNYYLHPEWDKEMVIDLLENVGKYGVYNFIYTK